MIIIVEHVEIGNGKFSYLWEVRLIFISFKIHIHQESVPIYISTIFIPLQQVTGGVIVSPAPGNVAYPAAGGYPPAGQPGQPGYYPPPGQPAYPPTQGYPPGNPAGTMPPPPAYSDITTR